MKIIHQDEVEGVLEGISKSNKILEEVIDGNHCFRSLQKVSELNVIRARVQKDWRQLFASLEYEPYGKRILDLGCGAVGNTIESQRYEDFFEPWLCRALYYHSLPLDERWKIRITGVDCGNLSKEVFPHKELNLLEENTLVNNFEHNSFDLVHASMLFNSPELEKRTTGKDVRDATDETAKNLKAILLPQIKHILKPEGIFLYSGGGRELFRDEPEYTEHFRNSKECRERLRPEKRYSHFGGY